MRYIGLAVLLFVPTLVYGQGPRYAPPQPTQPQPEQGFYRYPFMVPQPQGGMAPHQEMQPQAPAQLTNQAPPMRVPINVFSLSGLPNKQGQLVWPVSFHSMPQSHDAELLELRINAQFLAAMSQRAVEGQVDAPLRRDLRRSLARLRRAVDDSEPYLGLYPTADARKFLHKLDQAEKLLD